VRRLSTKQLVRKKVQKDNVKRKDSEFYLIEEALNDLGLVRQPAESLKNWIYRLKQELTTPDLIDGLISIIELHY
jgi:hypothetical protein